MGCICGMLGMVGMACACGMCMWHVWMTHHMSQLLDFVHLRRGLGAGFTDDNARPFFVAVMTIKRLRPKVWILECVDAVAGRTTNATASGDDLSFIKEKLREQLGSEHAFVTYQHRCPTGYGYPMYRPRFYIIGMRGEVRNLEHHCSDVTARITEVVSRPLPDFITFLDLSRQRLVGSLICFC